jgi:hypothetical protein
MNASPAAQENWVLRKMAQPGRLTPVERSALNYRVDAVDAVAASMCS